MDIKIFPSPLRGTVQAIPSKSQAHRVLICAAFSDAPTQIICCNSNQDIDATVDCLNALGANISPTENGFFVEPVHSVPERAVLCCRESGSTLRFLLPVVGALGVDTEFQMMGRLAQRPLSPLWEEMVRMGCQLSRPTNNTLRCSGRLTAGKYYIPGNISSQYVTGLLFAFSLIPGECTLEIEGTLESAGYVDMTGSVIDAFKAGSKAAAQPYTPPFRSPGEIIIEGDWSNAAFFLAAAKMDNELTLNGLQDQSLQGDRAVKDLLKQLEQYTQIDGSNVPDLIPILAVYAASKSGALFTNIGRLRLKESDRIHSVSQMLNRLGCKTEVTEDSLRVYPGIFSGCVIDAVNDHRIAMAGAIAATVASGPVTILGAQCVEKSYPSFWDVYRNLGGKYEQYIR